MTEHSDQRPVRVKVLFVTVCAFKAFELILYDCFPVDFYVFMTSGAIYIDVLPVQFESSPVVVELAGFPFFKCMALLATGHAVFFELAVMHIFVALCAGLCNSSKVNLGFCLVSAMTRRTVLPRVRSFKLVTGQIVIEPAILPGGA